MHLATVSEDMMAAESRQQFRVVTWRRRTAATSSYAAETGYSIAMQRISRHSETLSRYVPALCHRNNPVGESNGRA